MTWELESGMKKSYPKLFSHVIFEGEFFFKCGRVITPLIYLIIAFYELFDNLFM